MYFPLVVIIIFWQKVCIYASIFVCLKIVVSLWFIFLVIIVVCWTLQILKLSQDIPPTITLATLPALLLLYLKTSKYDWLLLGLSASFQHLFVLWQHLLFCAAWMPTSSIYATSPQVEGGKFKRVCSQNNRCIEIFERNLDYCLHGRKICLAQNNFICIYVNLRIDWFKNAWCIGQCTICNPLMYIQYMY